jgi:hypothetical protein
MMQAVNSRYTKYVAKRYGHAGHVFQHRFRATILEKSQYLLRLTGYLHLHPHRAKLCANAAQYRWSSYAQYLVPVGVRHLPHEISGRCQTPLEDYVVDADALREVLELLAREHPEQSYEDYVRTQPEHFWVELREQLRGPVLGSESFLWLIQQHRKLAAQHRHAPTPSIQLEEPRPMPMPRPQPRSVHRPHHPLMTVSLAVAFLSLCATGLYAKNMTTLKQTMRVLAQERRLLINGLADLVQETPGAQLMTYSSPMRLNGVSLEIDVRPASAAQAADLQRDRLEFRAGTMTSRELAAQGFLPSKYTLTYQKDGTVVWEAMQTDQTGTILTWRGEWDGQVMHGLIIREAPGNAPVQFDFIGAIQPQRKQPTSET